MDGSDIRSTSFRVWDHGYEVKSVRAVLDAVASDLDAGRSPESVINKARFRTWGRFGNGLRGYDIDAVDWFLASLVDTPPLQDRSDKSHDPWFVDPLANQFSRPDPDPTSANDPLSRQAIKAVLADGCRVAWHRAGSLPGTRLISDGERLHGGPWPVSVRRERGIWSEPTAWTAQVADTVIVGGDAYRLLPVAQDNESIIRFAAAAFDDHEGNHRAIGRWSPVPGSPKSFAATQKFAAGIRNGIADSDSRPRFTVSGANLGSVVQPRLRFPTGLGYGSLFGERTGRTR